MRCLPSRHHFTILTVFVVLLLACCDDSDRAATTDEPPILTVSGAIGKSNRGAINPFRDALLSFHGADFDRAYQFSMSELAALGMKEVVVKRANWSTAVTARGPALRDILNAVDAKGGFVTVVALDGYAVRFAVSAVQSEDVILAIEADGSPLAIGGRGPTWLIFNAGKVPGDDDENDGGLVWSAFYIKVEDE